MDQLGGSVDVFLDGGAAGGAASTIVDASRVTQAGGRVRIVREGAITRAQIQQLIGDELEPVVTAPTEPEEPAVPDAPEAPRGTASGAERIDGSADPDAAPAADAAPVVDASTDAGPTYPEFVEPADPTPADPTPADRPRPSPPRIRPRTPVTYYAAMAVVSAVITLVLSMVVMKLGYRYRLYPAIRARDVHTRPTPRLGGVAMFAGILVAFAVASQVSWFSLVFDRPGPVFAILGAALMIVVIGVLDDIYDLDWMIKLAGQILAAGLLAWQGVAISSLPIGGLTVGSSQMSIMLTIFAIVLVMNAVNFIDGLDGLVAGVAIIANGAFFLYSFLLSDTATGQTERFNLASLISAILIGACLGFLPFNWHPRSSSWATRARCSSASSWPRARSPSRARSTRTRRRSAARSCFPRSCRSSCPSRSSSSRCSTSPSRCSGASRPASRPSAPTASTCTTACSTWATRACTRR
ncbi:Decaprenyl-phosphate N-acetylglucosaminephosphotransferase [Clavibacter michiganensis subsp. michiganensis]|uniref:Decaprenyl-phosphate N-acetylglucosaminephosphotransferase n=1 Tax=Clavibacter michiganensis subsp. michiganensis TaxID=33013 RepID=A0A251XGK6_CLAMM|nr:Decaprenyl-phosphate N-acetylglucosaminephosphotransferase [Clavibacter michiganensis subsp. michiganensis]OUE01571.1 Decaprenyl-phosphate N-acetylglucosaminephosphotransferase [Clavibacter michiganensis subsp. michiganensis]